MFRVYFWLRTSETGERRGDERGGREKEKGEGQREREEGKESEEREGEQGVVREERLSGLGFRG